MCHTRITKKVNRFFHFFTDTSQTYMAAASLCTGGVRGAEPPDKIDIKTN